MLQHEPRAFTLSVHAQSNFPARKQHSDLDVGLSDGAEDADYLRVVGESLVRVLGSFRPDLVLYDAGTVRHRARYLIAIYYKDVAT